MTTDTGYPLGALSWSRRRQELEAEGYEIPDPSKAAHATYIEAVRHMRCQRCGNPELEHKPFQRVAWVTRWECRASFVDMAACNRCGWYVEF